MVLSKLLGNGLLTSNGDFWLKQRRTAQPAFHRAKIDGLTAVMRQSALELAERWERLVKTGEKTSMAEEMQFLTLNIAARTLLSADLQTNAYRAFGEALNVAFVQLNKYMVN